MAETLERGAIESRNLSAVASRAHVAGDAPCDGSRMAETQGLGARHRAQRHRRRRPPTAYLEYTTTCVSGRADNWPWTTPVAKALSVAMAIKMTANTLATTKKFRTRMTHSARLNAAQLTVTTAGCFTSSGSSQLRCG